MNHSRWVYRIDINIEAQTNNLQYFADFVTLVQAEKYDKCCSSKSPLQALQRFFFVDAIHCKFLFIFVTFILVNFPLNYILNSYLVYCYTNITHCIYIFAFNPDILSFFTKELECKILVKIPDSVLDSALALQGKEGDIVREKL